ncbi:recombination regulator RecX [Corynebacterium sp. TA-R-1]|uniref:Regulatory protein RecX n=1 Tax=Corynebacterium stercoris TaxID=2943490 RepID=A0ABT1G3N4_9CORY|nr:recombination regulator RecX [Corynebacterium stercoris]MCP1388647.1 recombination regulator RecX [Corynebacterium stercoris]
MTMNSSAAASNQPDPAKVAKPQRALEAYEEQSQSGEGTGLFDRTREEALAPIRKRALGLLDQRARSRHELRGRLIDAEFEPELVDDVLDSLEGSGLLDDRVFASEWVRQRAARRGKSARALDMELRDKGVAADVRAEALDQITEEDEARQARAFAEKKAREVKTPPADRAEYDKALRRVVGVLARRGYNAGMSMQLAREALDSRIADLQEG